jgi:hypothetical protein
MGKIKILFLDTASQGPLINLSEFEGRIRLQMLANIRLSVSQSVGQQGSLAANSERCWHGLAAEVFPR